MPEQINTIIPTKDELNLREQEPEERLLGSQVNKLATRGQRLDFIEKAESDAYEEYDSVLVRKANKLLLNPMLEPMDKERITALVKDATHSLQLLGAVITSLENKLSAPSERAVVSNMIDIIEKLVLKDYKNSKEISGTEIYSQDIETM
ncbi:MAG: hypothetical protein H6772_00940 [Pseudomonadales bacterium]|nr:hypothetical protein [Pseudomonadales bacterium]